MKAAGRLQLDPAQRHRQRPLRRRSARSGEQPPASPRSKAAAGASRDFAPGRRQGAVVANISRSTRPTSYLLDVATGQMTPIGNHGKAIAYGNVAISRPDGTLWATSDEGSRLPAARHARPGDRQIHRRWRPSRAGTSTLSTISDDGRFDRLHRSTKRASAG